MHECDYAMSSRAQVIVFSRFKGRRVVFSRYAEIAECVLTMSTASSVSAGWLRIIETGILFSKQWYALVRRIFRCGPASSFPLLCFVPAQHDRLDPAFEYAPARVQL